jgi:hypothetical protein
MLCLCSLWSRECSLQSLAATVRSTGKLGSVRCVARLQMTKLKPGMTAAASVRYSRNRTDAARDVTSWNTPERPQRSKESSQIATRAYPKTI